MAIVATSALLLAAGLVSASPALAGDPPPPPPPMPLPEGYATPGYAPAGPDSAFEDTRAVGQAPAGEAPAPALLTRDQLIELVGPVALYPDVVLASLLPATAFPLDVVSAARVARQPGADGKPTVPAEAKWDASVVALLQFPDVLVWLDDNLGWLEQMGAAMANQEAQVLEAIQEFRRRAREAGNLKSDEHMTVIDEPAPAQPQVQAIVIQPVRPEICYIPYYDPVVVLQPVYFYPEPIFTWSLGFTFGSWGPWCWHSIGWGWWDWRSRHYLGGFHYHSGGYAWFGFSSSRDRYFASGGTRWRSHAYSPGGTYSPYSSSYYSPNGSSYSRNGGYSPNAASRSASRGSAYSPNGSKAVVRSTTRPSWASSRSTTLRAGVDVRGHSALAADGLRNRAASTRGRISRAAPTIGSEPTLAATDRPFPRSFQDGRPDARFQDGRPHANFQDGVARTRTALGNGTLRRAAGLEPGVQLPNVANDNARSRFYGRGVRNGPQLNTTGAAPVIQAPTVRSAPIPRVYEPKVAPTPRVYEPRIAPTPRVIQPRVAPTPRVIEPRVTPRVIERAMPTIRAERRRSDPTPTPPPPPKTRRNR